MDSTIGLFSTFYLGKRSRSDKSERDTILHMFLKSQDSIPMGGQPMSIRESEQRCGGIAVDSVGRIQKKLETKMEW